MNGQEKEDALFNGAQSAEYWMYDSRIGRRWNIDPVVKPWESPYACFANNPIWFSDVKGDDATQTGDKGKGKAPKVDNTPPKMEGTVLPEIEVTASKTGGFWNKVGNSIGNVFRNIHNYISGNNDPKIKQKFDQRGGIVFHAPSMGGDEGSKSTARWTDRLMVNIDLLLAYFSYGGKEPLKGNIGDGKNRPLTTPDAIGNVTDIVQEVQDIKSNTPTTLKVTDADTLIRMPLEGVPGDSIDGHVQKKDFKEKGPGATISNEKFSKNNKIYK